ncbi:unnamed protein product [Choristocarpus tenellus]
MELLVGRLTQPLGQLRCSRYVRWTFPPGSLLPQLISFHHTPGSTSARTLSSRDVSGGAHMRKRMVPLIKMIHPDLFAQHSPEIRHANQTSLKDINTLIDALEALEVRGTTQGFVLPNLDTHYSFTFYHQPSVTRTGTSSDSKQSMDYTNQRQSVDGDVMGTRGNRESETVANVANVGRDLVKLHVVLTFPPSLLDMRNPVVIKVHLERQLGRLLAMVPGERGTTRSGIEKDVEDIWGTGSAEFETETGRGQNRKRVFRKAPPRDGLRMERASEQSQPDDTFRTPEELENLVLEHSGEHIAKPMPSRGDPGIFGRLRSRATRGQGGFNLGKEHAALDQQARNRLKQVDDLLRSGRVQFAGVPIVREASALRRLHDVLERNFERLELDDQGIWGCLILVLRAKTATYEVQAHTRGPLLLIPEEFKDRNLVRFLEDTMLRYS